MMRIVIAKSRLEYTPVITADVVYYCDCGKINSIYNARIEAHHKTRFTCESCGKIGELVITKEKDGKDEGQRAKSNFSLKKLMEKLFK